MRFRVEITETLKRGIIVEAQNEDAALDIVREHYANEDITLDASDFVDSDINVYPESEDLKPDYTETHLVCVAKGSGNPNRISYGKPAGDGFKYVLLHGLGPDTLPKDAGIIKLECYDNGMIFAYLDRVLSAAELADYGIPSEIENSYYEKLVNS